MAEKLTGSEQVALYLEKLVHPLKSEMEAARNLILSINEEISEHIKWNAPSFVFKGEDRITFNLPPKRFFRIVFHCGAKKKDKLKETTLIHDETGLLRWLDNERGVVEFVSLGDVNKNAELLKLLVQNWLNAEI